MYEILPEIWKLMNQLMASIFILATNLSWWLMKQEKVLTVLTISVMDSVPERNIYLRNIREILDNSTP